ncbi:MAG: type II secretion system F family protein [Candidatus Omnitrophica bacterium]|nr:type II secretion system F family protein [Candidatus Omnitrophota bacterium]
MPRFTYISRNPQGQRVTAVAEAESRQTLMSQLKERGLTVVEMKELGERPVQRKAARRRLTWSRLSFGRIDTGELAIFWREVATMVAAGLPVVEALESISEELEHVRLHKVLLDVISSMWEGFNFSQSMKKHPRVFSPMVVALIGAAEESGSLAEVADQLATYLENRDRLYRKVRAALTYPIFLCTFFLVVVAIATFWIIPKFREIYEGFNAKLPRLTEIVFAVNAFILHYFFWILAAGVIYAVAIFLWARTKAGRFTIDRVSLTLPIFGKLLQRAAVARFCRSLAILLSGGIPINRALEMAQETAGNRVVAKAIQASREEILKGSKIASSFKKHSVFPQMVIRMVSTGEETGNLSKLLVKTADFYEVRVDATLSTINTLIEPVMIVFVGAFVLLFVLSMYMPIFSLARTMRG